MHNIEDPFAILGVSFDATDEAVRSAYFSLVKQHPPERDPEGFKRLRKAYEEIRTSKDRALRLLQWIHDAPDLEATVGIQADGWEVPRDEDLVEIALSVTDLRRTSFKSDLKDLAGLLEAVRMDLELDPDETPPPPLPHP